MFGRSFRAGSEQADVVFEPLPTLWGARSHHHRLRAWSESGKACPAIRMMMVCPGHVIRRGVALIVRRVRVMISVINFRGMLAESGVLVMNGGAGSMLKAIERASQRNSGEHHRQSYAQHGA